MEIPLETITTLVTVGTAAAGALGAGWRGWARVVRPKIVEPINQHFKRIDEMAGTVLALSRDVKQVRDAVGPNGGKSLADALGRLETTMYHHDARQRMLMSALASPVFECDTHGLCVHANRALLNALDCTREELMGWEWVNFIDEPDRDRVMRSWHNAVKDNRSFYERLHYRLKDGRVWYVLVDAQPVRDQRGHVFGWFGVIAPIEEGK